MTGICTCYRCGHRLTMNEALGNWCITCRAEPQLQPLKRYLDVELRPQVAASETAVRR